MMIIMIMMECMMMLTIMNHDGEDNNRDISDNDNDNGNNDKNDKDSDDEGHDRNDF